MNIVGIAGSLRKASPNKGLLRYCQNNMPEGMTLTIADISELPFYNADLTTKPAVVEQFLAVLKQADGFIFATPEYNYSYAPALKNALDWASREPDNILLKGKVVSLMGAAGGMGSSRAQYHLRQVCVYLDLLVLPQPEVFANAFIPGNFDANGDLMDTTIQQTIDRQLLALQKLIQKYN